MKSTRLPEGSTQCVYSHAGGKLQAVLQHLVDPQVRSSASAGSLALFSAYIFLNLVSFCPITSAALNGQCQGSSSCWQCLLKAAAYGFRSGSQAEEPKDRNMRSFLRDKVPGLSEGERQRGEAWEKEMRIRYSSDSMPRSSGSGRPSGEHTSGASWSNRWVGIPVDNE